MIALEKLNGWSLKFVKEDANGVDGISYAIGMVLLGGTVILDGDLRKELFGLLVAEPIIESRSGQAIQQRYHAAKERRMVRLAQRNDRQVKRIRTLYE